MYNEILVSSLGFGLRLFVEKLLEGLDVLSPGPAEKQAGQGCAGMVVARLAQDGGNVSCERRIADHITVRPRKLGQAFPTMRAPKA
jgi:hypothetical protein